MNKEKVKELSEKTAELLKIDGILKIKKEAYELSIVNDLASKAIITTEVTELKKVIEVEALEDYKLTEKKKLYGGIGIKSYTTITYDADKALQWCKEKQMCLEMNTKAFEKVAPELSKDETQKLGFVTFSKKDIVTFPAEYILED